MGLLSRCIVTFSLLLFPFFPVRTAAAEAPWQWPLEPRPQVLRGFDPPEQRWSAGHLGADLAADPGQPVLAPAEGVVHFAGPVAGVPVVSLLHGGLRTTYLPVRAAVARGDPVEAGEEVGTLAPKPVHCPDRPCLHFGLLRGSSYLDPLGPLGHGPVRLLPVPPRDRIGTEATVVHRVPALGVARRSSASRRSRRRAGAPEWPCRGPGMAPPDVILPPRTSRRGSLMSEERAGPEATPHPERLARRTRGLLGCPRSRARPQNRDHERRQPSHPAQIRTANRVLDHGVHGGGFHAPRVHDRVEAPCGAGDARDGRAPFEYPFSSYFQSEPDFGWVDAPATAEQTQARNKDVTNAILLAVPTGIVGSMTGTAFLFHRRLAPEPQHPAGGEAGQSPG